MENDYNSGFVNDLKQEPARPQFLSVLCILTFIWSGLLIIGCLLGTFFLGMDEETGAVMLDKMMEQNPNLKIENVPEFFHQIGIASLIYLFAKILTFVGAVMMWKLNKIGFYLYVISQVATYFIGLNIGASQEGESSYGGTIFAVIVDIAFVAMYAANLKYMNKNKSTVTV